MVSLVDVVAVVGTYLVLAGFLSLTAFIAARNVLGDVSPDRALLVGPVPALVSFLGEGGLSLLGAPDAFSLLTAGIAIVADLATIRWVYDLEWRLAGYVTFIHVVVSILLGVVIGGGAILLLAG
jgi:hypothetical protein